MHNFEYPIQLLKVWIRDRWSKSKVRGADALVSEGSENFENCYLERPENLRESVEVIFKSRL